MINNGGADYHETYSWKQPDPHTFAFDHVRDGLNYIVGQYHGCWCHGSWRLQIITSHDIDYIQYIPRNMHTVFALLCFVVVIHWLIFPYPSGLLNWHCGNLTIAPVPAKQPWWIWINTSCEFIMNDCITTTKQSTTKLCAYFLGYTVPSRIGLIRPYIDCKDILWYTIMYEFQYVCHGRQSANNF